MPPHAGSDAVQTHLHRVVPKREAIARRQLSEFGQRGRGREGGVRRGRHRRRRGEPPHRDGVVDAEFRSQLYARGRDRVAGVVREEVRDVPHARGGVGVRRGGVDGDEGLRRRRRGRGGGGGGGGGSGGSGGAVVGGRGGRGRDDAASSSRRRSARRRGVRGAPSRASAARREVDATRRLRRHHRTRRARREVAWRDNNAWYMGLRFPSSLAAPSPIAEVGRRRRRVRVHRSSATARRAPDAPFARLTRRTPRTSRSRGPHARSSARDQVRVLAARPDGRRGF